MVQAGQTSPCYDADFYPFGGERDINSSCAQNYKFEGKERDAETNNDDFGARYYSSRLGRWLSADWSAAPAPVPYANLTNPQTLNLYAMVSDNPESFADLDGHCVPLGLGSCGQAPEMPHQHANDPFDGNGAQESEEGLEEESIIYQYAQEEQKEKAQQELVIEPTVVPGSQLNDPNSGRERQVDFNLVSLDPKGQTSKPEADYTVTLTEKLVVPDKNSKANPGICGTGCTSSTLNSVRDTESVSPSAKGHTVEKRFTILQNGNSVPVRVYDPKTKKSYDYVRVEASMKKGFVFNYGNGSQ